MSINQIDDLWDIFVGTLFVKLLFIGRRLPKISKTTKSRFQVIHMLCHFFKYFLIFVNAGRQDRDGPRVRLWQSMVPRKGGGCSSPLSRRQKGRLPGMLIDKNQAVTLYSLLQICWRMMFLSQQLASSSDPPNSPVPVLIRHLHRQSHAYSISNCSSVDLIFIQSFMYRHSFTRVYVFTYICRE